jgi:hypothetical protein
MKSAARETVVTPLRKQVKDFDISFHLNGMEMWTVLQTKDGANHIVRAKEPDFQSLLDVIERHLWLKIARRPRRFFTLHPFQPWFAPEVTL